MSKRHNVVPQICETYLSHLLENKILFLMEVKSQAQQKYKNDFKEEMRNTVTS